MRLAKHALRNFRIGRVISGLTLAAILCGNAIIVCAQSPSRSASSNEVIEIDANAPPHPFPHFWEKMFGSGRAILSLRESYRHDLRETKRITGFEYVRFHAIFQSLNASMIDPRPGPPNETKLPGRLHGCQSGTRLSSSFRTPISRSGAFHGVLWRFTTMLR